MEALCEVTSVSRFQEFWWKVRSVFRKKEPSGLLSHAKREFRAAGYLPVEQCEDDPNKWIQESVLELLAVFSKQGHSGFSAAHCIDMFKKLASYEPLVPLSGDDDEWTDVGEMSGFPIWQNNRCHHVFKEGDGKAYDIDGIIFREPNGCCYTSKESRVYIDFPYTPTRKYVDVPASQEGE